MPTLFQQATLINATIGMTIGIVTDATIVGIAIVVALEEVVVTGGIDLHMCRNYHLQSN
jgi:hypothetical protein